MLNEKKINKLTTTFGVKKEALNWFFNRARSDGLFITNENCIHKRQEKKSQCLKYRFSDAWVVTNLGLYSSTHTHTLDKTAAVNCVFVFFFLSLFCELKRVNCSFEWAFKSDGENWPNQKVRFYRYNYACSHWEQVLNQ